MGKNSGVDWTDASWGPWRGCRKRAPECLNCYGERDMKRYGWDPSTVARSKTTFQDPLKWRKSLRVFVCPWSDFFIQDADPWRDEAWAVMRAASQHTYIIPTKRPHNIKNRLPVDWGEGWSNVWLLVSAGTQESADKLVPELLSVRAAVRGVSVEPMLEPVDLEQFYPVYDWRPTYDFYPPSIRGDGKPILIEHGLSWIICGAESGPNRRPMELDWARDLVQQCKEAEVPMFVKQLPIDGRVSHDPAEWPEDLRVREWPA